MKEHKTVAESAVNSRNKLDWNSRIGRRFHRLAGLHNAVLNSRTAFVGTLSGFPSVLRIALCVFAQVGLAVLVLGVGPVATAAEEQPRHFDIKTKPLADAVMDFGVQSGLTVVAPSALTQGKKSSTVRGDMLPTEALQKLLVRSGLAFVMAADGTVTIQEAGKQLGQANDRESSLGKDLTSDNNLQEILITGSRLRTNKSASPVTVITQEDIQKQGLNTVEDIIRSIPQNLSTVNAATSVDNSLNSVDAQGQSAANLRGLGPENTLVLVNGRRRAVSSTFSRGVVNVNTIPAGSIERVEIITDGASSIYGSDAVAGVINFILKKDFQGGETHVRYEVGRNGGDTSSVDQSLGERWSSGNVTFSGRYSRETPVNTRKAGFTTEDLTSFGGSDFRNSQVGQPGVVTDASGNLIGSLPAGDNGAGGIAGKLSPINVVPYDDGKFTKNGTAETNSFSFDINAEQSLGSRVRAYAEVSYSRNNSYTHQGPQLTVSTAVPTTNRFNDTGQTVYVGYVFAQEYLDGLFPVQEFVSDQKALGETLGFKITLPRSWAADISVNHSQEDAFFSGTALDPTLLAERAAGVDAQGNALPAAQQLNFFGNGTAQNPAALAGLFVAGGFAPSTNRATDEGALLTAEGPLFKLPSGVIRLAAGGEFRKEGLNYSTASGASDVYSVLNPSRTVAAVFSEATLPVFGEQKRVPGIYSLDLFAAARWEEYAVSGPFNGTHNPSVDKTFSQSSPKIGIAWYVWPELKVRSTLSRSFRAPVLPDLFQTTLGPFNFGFPIFDPVKGVTVSPNLYFTGNPSLQPQTANNLTAGIDWKPMGSLRGLALALTYSNIDFKNLIGSSSDLFFSGNPALFSIPGVVVRDANGNITQINLEPINLVQQQSKNVDYTLTYDFNTRAGAVTLGVTGTYAIKLDQINVPGVAPQVLVGTELGPEKNKRRTWVSWSRTKYGLNLFANFSSSYTNTNSNISYSSPPQAVDHYMTYDLTGFYNFASGWSINGGARNLTNAEFPFFNGSRGPWDSRRVDLRGRTIYLEIAKKYGLPWSR